MRSVELIQSDLASASKNRKWFFKQCLLILDFYNEDYIRSEIKKLDGFIKIHKQRTQTKETVEEIKSLTARKRQIKYLLNERPIRGRNSTKTSAAKPKGEAKNKRSSKKKKS